MPGVMANNDNGNVAAQRDPSPELQRQRGCWSKFWCLGTSRKRGMRIVPARAEGSGPASNWASNGASSSTAANQFVGLSPSLLAPPSSPASFANSGNPSTVQSPAAFTVSLCVPPVSSCSPAFDSTATMFTIGPYAHETTLVTPPAFSAFTTAPSTAPFTPPPELAHLTTPSSPDVPFAQLLTSLKNRSAVGHTTGNAKSPYSASPFASPDYISRSNPDLQTSYHMYPESPLTSLISPASGISESGPPSPLPELEFPAAVTAAAAKSRTVRMTSFSATSEASHLFRRRGYDTPQSVDSNNHSRELEPIKILSPPMDISEPVRSPKVGTPARSGDSALPTSNKSAVEEQQQQDDNRSLSLLQAGMDSSHQPEEESVSVSQRDESSRCSSKTEEHQTEAGGEETCRSGSSSGRIVLKVEVICDDQVKVNMRARNGRYFHHHQEQHQEVQHERSVNDKQQRSPWEDIETVSLDCMELNLVNHSIKGDETGNKIVDNI